MTPTPLPTQPLRLVLRPLLRSPLLRGSALCLALLLLWDFSGLDLPMAQLFGGPQGFAQTDSWLWAGLLHDDLRPFPWLLEIGLMIAVWWPIGSLRLISRARRAQFALTTLLALLLVSSIKIHSSTSCPWDLQQFGGVAQYVSHWAWGLKDGGTGGCFPAGHASAGFAFLGGFFALRHTAAKNARRWLIGAMLAGLVLGLAQQIRGAHYMSHTLWTAWFCWCAAAALDALFSSLIAWRQRSQKPSPARAPALAPEAPRP